MTGMEFMSGYVVGVLGTLVFVKTGLPRPAWALGAVIAWLTIWFTR